MSTFDRTGPEVAFTLSEPDGMSAILILTGKGVNHGVAAAPPVPEGHIRIMVAAEDAARVEELLADANLPAEGKEL